MVTTGRTELHVGINKLSRFTTACLLKTYEELLVSMTPPLFHLDQISSNNLQICH